MTHLPSFPNDTIAAAASNVRRLSFALKSNSVQEFPAVAKVQAHYDVLRAGRIAPARAEIDPRPLAEALDVMFVAEVVAPGVARMRLCGQHLNELLGMEPRGMPLSVFFAPEARDDVAKALAQVANGARASLPLRAEKGLGRPGLDGMLVLLPLTDHTGAITRILGVLETCGQIGRAPRKFKLRASAEMKPVPPRATGKPVLQLILGGRS
ncbi:PAS domain-containing protein [Pararhodobacter sp.]|uniref:PAS domain-containing protein n=1 Tax=Pararhodobacter sp. TaxID=2127056 RepID=UPI002AFDE611|nr:PAS domain-containing protein [Pararhodobacter sp.]